MNVRQRVEALEARTEHSSQRRKTSDGRPPWFTAEEWAERERAFEVLRGEIRAYAKTYFGVAEEDDDEKGVRT